MNTLETFPVHKLDDNLVISLVKLPGFKRMGKCVVRDSLGDKSGEVDVFYSGDFFECNNLTDTFNQCVRTTLRLAQNYAIKMNIGVATTRLNLSTSIRQTVKGKKDFHAPNINPNHPKV